LTVIDGRDYAATQINSSSTNKPVTATGDEIALESLSHERLVRRVAWWLGTRLSSRKRAPSVMQRILAISLLMTGLRHGQGAFTGYQ
jgi:hypothetical protein